MIKLSYRKYYLKAYFWKTISLVSGFLSLLIVVPHLSSNLELFGIYSFCISFMLYLTYADIGFLAAGQKYAAEEYAKNNRKREIEILGFTGMILLLMILPFSLGMFYFSFYPEKVLNNLSNEGAFIAGRIFLILAIISPFQILLQRVVQSILIIRIKDYISLRIDIAFNILKIFSVFFFFNNEKYLIVEYFLFINILTIIGSILVIGIIQRIENYDFTHLIKSIKLSKEYFRLTKKLALSSLVLTIGWLIYYELDLVIIGKWLGPNDVAIYAISFTFLNFLRSLWNIVYSPYSQRFNHFSGTNDHIGIKYLAKNIIEYTAPLGIIVSIVLILSAEEIVQFWVGTEYNKTVLLLQILIGGTIFNFISQPANYYFIAKTKYRFIYAQALVLPTTFFLGIITLVPKLGLLGFAISKTLAMTFGFIISLIGISQIVKVSYIFKKWILSVPIFVLTTIYYFPKLLSSIFTEHSKSSSNLALLMFIAGTWILIGIIFNYLSHKEYRIMFADFIKRTLATLIR